VFGCFCLLMLCVAFLCVLRARSSGRRSNVI
jgi:hypothetical protein